MTHYQSPPSRTPKEDHFVVHKLNQSAILFDDRNTDYGESYVSIGKVLKALQGPEPLVLKTEADHARYCAFMQIAGKLHRYAANFDKGGHQDSLDDITVYAQMLQHLDNIER